jgi:hypothetical protein
MTAFVVVMTMTGSSGGGVMVLSGVGSLALAVALNFDTLLCRSATYRVPAATSGLFSAEQR